MPMEGGAQGQTDLTTKLCYLMERPLTITLENIKVIDSFVVSLNSVTCPITEVNQVHQQIVAQPSRIFEYLYLQSRLP